MRSMTGPRLLTLISIAIAAMCAVIVAVMGPGPDAAHAVVRWTARTSFVLFALAYVARPALELWPSPVTRAIMARRKWIGLGFALSHLMHLLGIIAIAWPDPAAFVRSQDPTILVAVATFIAVFAMAITSIDAVRRRMSRRAWTGLHKTGIHLAWVPFATTYILAAMGSPGYIAPAVLVIAIAIVRAAAWIRGRRRASARAMA
jgi:DMSO/TMAO reductase YedYZ heme-binding membrane subunit